VPRPKLHPDAHDRILDAADRLLARDGYARMTVESLAREARIGKGTVYLSFRSKEEVALACIDRMAGGVLARLRRIATGRAPAGVRLRAMLLARVMDPFDYARRHSHSLDALLAASRPRLLARRARRFAAEATVLAAVVRDGTRAGELRSAAPAADAGALVTGTNALLPYSLSVSELGRRHAVEARAARLADLLVSGLERPARARRLPPPLRRSRRR
jgi:AcrR family transcriptional regulator